MNNYKDIRELSHYEILNVDDIASQEQIEASYNKVRYARQGTGNESKNLPRLSRILPIRDTMFNDIYFPLLILLHVVMFQTTPLLTVKISASSRLAACVGVTPLVVRR